MSTYLNISQKLADYKLALANAKNVPEIASALATFGYDTARLNEGQTLYQKALELHQAQTREYGEQYGATDTMNAARDRIQKTYMTHIKLARLALKDNLAATQALGLNGDRQQSFSGWLEQVKQFYANLQAQTSWQEALSTFGITAEHLAELPPLLAELEELRHTQQQEKGEAQGATKARDQAFDELSAWMNDFFVVARIALEDSPQLLESLGKVVPS